MNSKLSYNGQALNADVAQSVERILGKDEVHGFDSRHQLQIKSEKRRVSRTKNGWSIDHPFLFFYKTCSGIDFCCYGKISFAVFICF